MIQLTLERSDPNNEYGKRTLASYDWIDLTAPEGYAPLAANLDPEFDPEQVAELLRSQVTDLAKALLVEHDYVDKDYRSTFYNFYATKGRRYRSDCVRLHFFDDTVRYDEERTNILSDDGRPQDHYYGYIVLRPTIVATLGRSVLSPRIRRGARGRAIQSVHHVNLLGHRLPVWGFPSMAQHIDIAVCAHVSCWAILRYYSETFPQHREYLVHDITKLVAPFDPGGLVPSLGFSVLGAERVFQAAGCFPVLVGKQNTSEDGFYSQLLAYLESGFPLFVAMNRQRHAVVVVGYDWRKSDVALGSSESSHVWEKIETVLAVDDNLLPYRSIAPSSGDKQAGEPGYTAESFDAFIVALPDKIYYPADAIDKWSQRVAKWLPSFWGGNEERVKLRRYFITTLSELRKHARDNQSLLGNNLVGLTMQLDTAQFVWLVEYCSGEQWEQGRVAARAIVDATASPQDPMPMWLLHDEEVAIVADRSSAESEIRAIHLNRSGLGPLPRTELNLWPVGQAGTTTGGNTAYSGGQA